VHPVRVNPAVFELVRIARSISLLPGSLFNLTIGPLVKCWKIGFQGNRVPQKEELQSRRLLCNPQDVLLADISQTVFLAKTEMEIDLGAIAKGYIADCVQAFLRQQGIKNALINLGGNGKTLGKTPDAAGWLIGVRKPLVPRMNWLAS